MTNKTKLEPMDCDCEDCGATIVVDSFWDGDEYYCPECGWRHMWSVYDVDDASLVMLEDKTPGQVIADLLAKLETVSMALKITMGEHFTVDNHGSKELREAVAIAEQALKGEK